MSIIATTKNVLHWQERLQIGQIANLCLTKGASEDTMVLTGARNGLMREIVHVLPTGVSVVLQVHGHTSNGNCHFVKGDW